MTRVRKDRPWQGYWIALVPNRWEEGAADNDPPTCGRPVLVDLTDKDEQELFYKALLELKRLSPKVQRALKDVLGMPGAQKEKAGLHRARAAAYRSNIKEDVARMRASGEKPREGVGEAAIAREADRVGMKVEALKQYLYRHAPTKRSRT